MSSKHELISRIAREHSLSINAVSRIMESLAAATAADLKEFGEALIPGVAKVKLIERAARTGRNPKTGEPVEIESRKAVKFTALKSIKDGVA